MLAVILFQIFLLILLFIVFPIHAHTRLVTDLFLMLHHLSGTISLAKLGHQEHTHLSDRLWNLTSSSYPTDCVCTRVWIVFWFFVVGCVLQNGKTAHKRIHYHHYYVGEGVEVKCRLSLPKNLYLQPLNPKCSSLHTNKVDYPFIHIFFFSSAIPMPGSSYYPPALSELEVIFIEHHEWSSLGFV